MSTGIVSATAGIRDDETRLQFSAPVQPGNSGGALLNRRGHVIGVVQSVLNPISQGGQVFIPQNVNFAIKAFVLRSALAATGREALTRDATSQPLDNAALGRLAQAMSGQVRCYRNSLEAQIPTWVR